MKLEDLKIGDSLPVSGQDITYRCNYWPLEERDSITSLLDNNRSRVIKAIEQEYIHMTYDKEIWFIIPISELIRIGIIENFKSDYNIF